MTPVTPPSAFARPGDTPAISLGPALCRWPLGVALIVVLAMSAGCASWRSKQQIIRVEASRRPAEAARLTLVGVKALREDDRDRAADRFLGAIAADETYGPAHNNLGLLHYEQGNLYEAVLAFEQAMDLMPQDPAVYYNLALTLESAGKVFEATELYTQAVAMDPTNPMFLGNLVRLRIRLGENDPSLVAQLQDLILIETRPEWRRWADRQLALNLNPTLDRGPAAPEFETQRSEGPELSDEELLRSKIIELSPETASAARGRMPPETLRGPRLDELRSTPQTMPSQTLPPPTAEPIERPPIVDDGSLGSLPPSILVPQ
jgi:Tfp pilus assembly protein PilF